MRSLALLALPALLLPLVPRTAPAPSPAPAPAAAAAETFQIDAAHSSMVFRVKHNGVAWFYGRFNQLSGSFVLDEADPSKSSIQVEVPAESVDTGNQKRDDHLRSPDFFSAKEFPTLKFQSTKVTEQGDGYLVEGDLSLHGVTKPVRFEAQHTGSADGRRGKLAGVHAELDIKRSDFGMNYGLPDGIGDEVRVYIGLEGNKK